MRNGFYVLFAVLVAAFCVAFLGQAVSSDWMKLMAGFILMPGGWLSSFIVRGGPSGGAVFLLAMFLGNALLYGGIWFLLAKFIFFRRVRMPR